ncbi:MAG: transcriptional regulator, GntR family [Ramlibacter sp.]|nr:transcriptional regulator, GntR family [Ramlibacter sp.]
MRTSSVLRDAIYENLRTGQWRAGDRLPTERQLSEQYQLSRTAVRRVLAVFKEQKLIRQTVGSGTFANASAALVSEPASDRLTVTATSPGELMTARLVLEPAIVELVVYNATFTDFAKMDQCCERAERAASLDEFEHWDAMFHEAIAEAAHNSFILNVFRLINAVRDQSEWGLLKKRSVTAERRIDYQAEHRALGAALRQRDQALARELTLAHLAHVRRNLLGY